MRRTIGSWLTATACLLLPDAVGAEVAAVGTEEFGLNRRQLVQRVEQVEQNIAKCMREQGFEYVAVDFKTVRKGMKADKKMPGLSEEEFYEEYGFGISTLYSGVPPQLSNGYSPARVGLGERNVQVYQDLAPADRVAYNRALLGENSEATFAVGLETENFSRTGGCTRKAIEAVFEPEEMSSSYYNPLDVLMNKDPRMKAAIREYAQEMRKAGFDYGHPDEVEIDIRQRLDALVAGVDLPVEQWPPDKRAALKELQDYERRVAVKSFELEEEIFEPVEERIEKELFARKVE